MRRFRRGPKSGLALLAGLRGKTPIAGEKSGFRKSRTSGLGHVLLLIVPGLMAALPVNGFAQSEDMAPGMFQRWVKRQGESIRAGDVAPATKDEWEHRRAALKVNLLAAWGGFPETPCELEPRKLGEFQREGYRVEKLILQTRPGVWMTANAYVPDKPGKRPAILHVHGHWSGAKQDPVVQSRCIGCAKHGFFVLSVDAFGAGERGISKNLGEYHGEMTGAMLLPIGMPLSGLQVYENMRAVDYLQSRPEVDPQRIGITGASGGGNQTMYAGGFDERFRCVVPTCSVGTYQSYLSAACCMCEVVPGALRFTEEGDVLGLAAHRGVMVTSATKDAFQFSVGEAKKSFTRVEAIAKLYDKAAVKHTIIESPHAYNQPMREAMYGWMTLHLKGEGDGSPLPDPEVKPEEPEALRCFPGDSRPDDFVTLPRFAAAEARKLLSEQVKPKNYDEWQADRTRKLTALEAVLGGMPQPDKLSSHTAEDDGGKSQAIFFNSEPGIAIRVKRDLPAKPSKLAVILNLDGHNFDIWSSAVADQWRAAGWNVAAPQLRATGNLTPPGDKIGNAPDHNSAEWALWIGRPLLGQWTWDVKRTLDAIAEQDGSLPQTLAVVGVGPAGVIALTAAALDERISHTIALNSLASYVTEEPYRGQRLGLMAPRLVRDVGDIDHIASLIAPRPIVIAGGVAGGGKPLSLAALRETFGFAANAFSVNDAEAALSIVAAGDDAPALASAAPAVSRGLHLYLLIGQSNMAGRGAMSPDALAPPRVMKLDKENHWVPATDPLHFDKPQIAGVGPGSGFGPAMAEADPSITIGLIPCAVGGTPLKRWEKGGDLYAAALARTRIAMRSGTLKGVIWHQGESDATETDTATSYGARLAGMIAALRKDVGQPDVPFVVGQLGEFLSAEKSPHAKTVNAALVDLPNKVPHTACVDAKELTHKGDVVHFDADSARELGRRYAKSMRTLQSAESR